MSSVACGRIYFDRTTDAGNDDTTTTDTTIVSNGAWGTPVAFDLGITADDPTMTADGLELYVNNGSLVYGTTRASTSDPWPPATVVTSLPSPIYSPHLSPDGLTLWAVTAAPSRIVVTTRATRTDSWSAWVDIPEIADPSGDDAPSVSSDGLTMVFDSNRGMFTPGIFLSERMNTTASWGAPIELVGLATGGFAGRPAMSDDGLEIYFQGAGNDNAQDNDLWVARRGSRSEAFGPPTIVPELDTPEGEEDPWLSPDGRTLLFAGFVGSMFRIQQATR